MGRFDGKVAVVTGASRGIGYAIAERLGSEGAAVAVVSTSAEHSDEAVRKLLAAGVAKAIGYACDVASAGDVASVSEKILADFGAADILVNNAGITRDTLLMRLDEEAWDKVLDVDLKGAYLMSKAFTRSMMKARYGRIICISSVVALTGNAGQSNYAAAKAGLIGFGKSLAREIASRNITVNMVAPGFIETDMTAVLPDAAKQAFVSSIPLGRPGRPEDVAGAVAFLASSDADYITGQVISVNGGLQM